MKKLLFVVLGVIFPVLSYAGEETGGIKIKTIATGWQGADIYVWPTQSVLVDGCTSAFFRMSTTHPLKDEMLSLLLSAYHNDTTVKIYVDGCISGAMQLQAVKLNK